MSDILGPASAINAVTTRIAESRIFQTVDSWFRPCSTPAAQDGTQIQAVFFNGLLAQMRAAIRGNGDKLDGVTPLIPENNANDGMLLGAIQALIQRGQATIAVDTGAADALVAGTFPAVAEYKPGMRFVVLKNPLVGANATTTPTINLSGLGAVTIVKCDASALGIGDLKKGGLFEVEFDGTNARLVSLLTLSDVLALIAANVFSGTFTFNGPGTYSFTIPTGVTRIKIRLWGAGGAGAGGTGSLGQPGGGGGSYAQEVFNVTPGTVYPVTGGTGGIGGGPGVAGGNGGATSFGSLLTAPGGQGGQANAAIGGAPGTPTSGDLTGGGAFGGAGISTLAGAGGGSGFGGAGGPGTSYGGTFGSFPGGGGSGGGGEGSGFQGGGGAHGAIVMEW